MAEIITSPSLNLLRNLLDFTRVPFSDRGSRLLVFLNPEKCNIFIRLAERLASLDTDVEAYIRRPPFIYDLTLIDGNGDPLKFETTTYPHMIFFNTELGDFGLTFLDDETLALGLPPGKTVGIKFHVSPQFWKTTNQEGCSQPLVKAIPPHLTTKILFRVDLSYSIRPSGRYHASGDRTIMA